MKEKINIVLNGKNVQGFKGETVLELCRRLNVEIPTLCHDDRLEPYSSCYLCVVEIEGMKGLQPSCSTHIREGMVVETQNDKISTSRKTALDLMLSNHYADCLGPCKQTCPAGVDVQGYISHIEKGQYSEAVALIKETNPLPAICGRVCVRPCEVACRRNLLDEGTGVGIDYMKRFAADVDLYDNEHYKPEVAASTGKKIAIIGGGPGGLSAAYFLQQKGHQCDIFEAAPKAGGWLRYGIPEYRLPNDLLDKEISTITELGVNIYCNKKLGDNLKYKEVKDKYDATILTIGSQKGTLIGCEGDDAENVFSGIDFLRNMEMTGQRYDFTGKKVIVVGGGNTAMDCCRTSIRCGSTDVKVIYRRTEKEMPANPIEIHESKLEGVEYMLLTNPKRVNKDENGVLKSVTCLKMELGAPDSSGRRRPVPIEGSEFDLEVDYILAAIGQKTQADFIDDINNNVNGEGELKLNRWGDLDCDEKTLQSGVENIFAAGDGVTGPATIIEAIAQAKIASRSCHQYLSGEKIEPEKPEFLSKKENFKEQLPEDYKGKFVKQLREEMPTLPADSRINFDEVELGYKGEQVAKHEADRCLECGCVELFTCDLKKYATEYSAEQKKYDGEFKEYNIDFSHPFVEFDNNKCILCSRCVRICREVVGANALGLVERGFDTYVAPALGNSLVETNCESCGLCISTCPTGAISENMDFKPGPVKTDQVDTICNYCSIGCEISYDHKNGFVMGASGKHGLVNYDGNICKYGKFGYQYLNDKNRLTKPLVRRNGKFEEISFEEAYELITKKIKSVKPDENSFYGGARLTNEEQYLIQKLARQVVGTNHVNSFYYIHGDWGYVLDSAYNTPFNEIRGASKIYLLGADINNDNGVLSYQVNNIRYRNNISVELITEKKESSMEHKVDQLTRISSYYNFIKAVNHYILTNQLENQFFIKGNVEGFEDYKTQLLEESFSELAEKAGLSEAEIADFAKAYNKEMNAIIIYAEKEVCPNTSFELQNLAMITGKISKTSNGLISLKEKNNAHGILDMGVCNKFGVGTQLIDDDEYVQKVKKVWNIEELPVKIEKDHYEVLRENRFKNMFVFGEDPVGCAIKSYKNEVKTWFENADFIMVQDYFMTETAALANLILPASIPVESGGTFTNTQKVIQEFKAGLKPGVEKLSYQQLLDILGKFGVNGLNDLDDISSEAFSLLKPEDNIEKHHLTITKKENVFERIFKHGCDFLVKKFDEDFEKAFTE